MKGSFREIYTDAISGTSASAIFLVMSGWFWGVAQHAAEQKASIFVVALLLFATGFLGIFFSITVAIDKFSSGTFAQKALGFVVSVLLACSITVMMAATLVQGWSSVPQG